MWSCETCRVTKCRRTPKWRVRMSFSLLVCDLCLHCSFCMRVACLVHISFRGVFLLLWRCKCLWRQSPRVIQNFVFCEWMNFVHRMFVNSMGSRIADPPKKDACQIPCRSWILLSATTQFWISPDFSSDTREPDDFVLRVFVLSQHAHDESETETPVALIVALHGL